MLGAALHSVGSTDGSRGLAEELIPLKPRSHAIVVLKNQVLDRTKVLYSPWTQAYGETNYLSKSSFGQNQGIAWSSDSSLWGNQLLIKIKFWTKPRYCMVLGLKPMGKPTTYQNQVLDKTKVLHGPRTQIYGETNYLKIKFWIEPRYCIVLGLKPIGKPTI